MVRSSIIISLALLPAGPVGPVRGQAFDGLTLYGNINSRTTYLKDNSGQTINTWSSSVNCAYMAYLLPDSTIWRGDVNSGATMRGAAYGGRIQQYRWDGTIARSFLWSNSNHQQHHDIHPMPNGNVLLVSWDRKTRDEALAMGRVNITGDIWPDEVIEYDPVADSVVWEWHFWDHLIQDVDPSKPNYGVVAEHPERLDINLGTVQQGDWIHCNTVDYNAERDEIMLTSHNLHELFIIDHSTTTEEARGSTGGRHGKGGDFLWRWGNPQNYDRGASADRVFYIVHGGNWIRPGMPGEGNILVLNNGDRPGSSGDSSSAIEISPPLDSNDRYYIHPDSAFGPRTPAWSYSNGSSFYTQHLGGAYRLPNGNTFCILGTSGRFVEVTAAGQVAWQYTAGGQIGRAMKYPRDYTGLAEPGVPQLDAERFRAAAPNPFVRVTNLTYSLETRSRVKLAVLDAAGRVVARLADCTQESGPHVVRFEAGSGLPAGVYFGRLEIATGSGWRAVATQQLIKEH